MSLFGMGARSARGGPPLLGSMAFNAAQDAAMRISQFSSTNPDQTAFTIAFWIRCDATGEKHIFRYSGPSSYRLIVELRNDLRVQAESDGPSEFRQDATTTATLSVNNWHSVGLSFDGALADPNTRFKIHIDGALAALSRTITLPSIPSVFRDGCTKLVSTNANQTSFHLADLIVIEGLTLTPNELNRDSAGGGRWKDYPGPFGPHGFRLNPQTPADLGKDMSGNGFHFDLLNMDASNFDATELPPQ